MSAAVEVGMNSGAGLRRNVGMTRTIVELIAIAWFFLLELIFGSDDHEPDEPRGGLP